MLSASELASLKVKAAQLAKTTTLRIRTEASVPGGDLNAYEKKLQIHCGWADATNVRQPKLLVVMVSTGDRQMGIYPGPALTDKITKPVWLGIEQEQMRPFLSDQDWADGLGAAVDSLAKVVAGESLDEITKAGPSASAAAASAAAASDDGEIRYDENGNMIQGDGTAAHPFIEDPNGVLPGSPGPSSDMVGGGLVMVAIVAMAGIGIVVALVLRLSSGGGGPRSYRRSGPFLGQQPGMFPDEHQRGFGGGFGDMGGSSGGMGGGDMGGGGGSSSDGGGGSSGF